MDEIIEAPSLDALTVITELICGSSDTRTQNLDFLTPVKQPLHQIEQS